MTIPRRRVALVCGWALATAVVVVGARAIDWRRTLEVLSAARPGWIAAAVVANVVILPCMAAFWRVLRPLEESPVSFGRMIEIASTAWAVMNTVPFGAGQASVVVLLVRSGRTTQRGALSILALDQLGEGLAKVSIFLLVGLLVPLPPWMRAGVMTTSLLVAAWFVTLIVASRWRGGGANELQVLKSWRRSAGALACVAGMKVAEVAAIVAVQHAFGVDITAGGTLVVLAAVILGTIVSVTPGNLGAYEASVFLAYRYLGVAPEQALSLALVQHVCMMVPAVGVGYVLVSTRAFARSAIASR